MHLLSRARSLEPKMSILFIPTRLHIMLHDTFSVIKIFNNIYLLQNFQPTCKRSVDTHQIDPEIITTAVTTNVTKPEIRAHDIFIFNNNHPGGTRPCFEKKKKNGFLEELFCLCAVFYNNHYNHLFCLLQHTKSDQMFLLRSFQMPIGM